MGCDWCLGVWKWEDKVDGSRGKLCKGGKYQGMWEVVFGCGGIEGEDGFDPCLTKVNGLTLVY